ncbi:chaplin family protein [Streptomyces sp. NPDC002403]
MPPGRRKLFGPGACGNVIRVPVHVPVNTVDMTCLLDPASGNAGRNGRPTPQRPRPRHRTR